MISFVVAASENNAIGKDNKLLWCLPNDMKFFKNTTWGMTVVMGRKTFESLGKPLKGRRNIVITRQPDWKAEGVTVAANLDDALKAARETDAKEIMIIGGGEIFKKAFAQADRVYITRVKADLEGDTFFPAIDPGEWKLVSHDDHSADAHHAYDYSFQVWERQ